MPPLHRHLRIAAQVEIATLALLLGNLFTVHERTLSGLLGPVHGGAYLVAVLGVLHLRGASLPAKLSVLVPGVGAMIAVRLIAREGEREGAGEARATGP